MANRQSMPHQQKGYAATAAFCLLAAIFSAPAHAATNSRIPCSEDASANLDVSDRALITQLVNNEISAASLSLLAPRAEAAIREAFKESDSVRASDATTPITATIAPPMAATESEPDASADSNNSNNSVRPVGEMTTKLPGVSDDTLARYKKQMYRRDI